MVSMDILWQGIHLCVVTECTNCHAEIIEDVKIGHAICFPYKVDIKNNKLFGVEKSKTWLGTPLFNSLKNPKIDIELGFRVEKFQYSKNVIILNCIDFLYGHSLLKLLNAETHLKKNRECRLIVIVPHFLRWMVPSGVAEIWSVNINLSDALNYFPELDRHIKKECDRFDSIHVSLAYPHPKQFNITRFTGIEKHDFERNEFRITFIWREDRIWWKYDFLIRAARKLRLSGPILIWQNLKIRRLFSLLRKDFSEALFTVTGLGKSTTFPSWIEDERVETYTEDHEKHACRNYAESRLVIGVHGSHMLLPSGHAGMSMDLMPPSRWGNIAQDILYQEGDNRLSSFKYRYIPISTNISMLYKILKLQLSGYASYKKMMCDDCSTFSK
jgi:hypothetical protein